MRAWIECRIQIQIKEKRFKLIKKKVFTLLLLNISVLFVLYSLTQYKSPITGFVTYNLN